MSNYGGLALWQTALGDSILRYVAQMLKLLLGWGLALEDALVDEIRDVVHHVFGHLSLSRCAVRRRQFRRRSLRNSSGVLGCGVHMLGDAARR
jgi:RNase P/RNase MRP subunit POP5